MRPYRSRGREQEAEIDPRVRVGPVKSSLQGELVYKVPGRRLGCCTSGHLAAVPGRPVVAVRAWGPAAPGHGQGRRTAGAVTRECGAATATRRSGAPRAREPVLAGRGPARLRELQTAVVAVSGVRLPVAVGFTCGDGVPVRPRGDRRGGRRLGGRAEGSRGGQDHQDGADPAAVSPAPAARFAPAARTPVRRRDGTAPRAERDARRCRLPRRAVDQVSLKKRVSWVYQPMFFVAYSHSLCSSSSFSISSWTSYRKSGAIRSRTAR